MKELNVFLGRNCVGVLGLDSNGGFCFQYASAWIDRPDAFSGWVILRIEF